MRHARGEQRQSLDALALDGFKRSLPRLGCIMKDQSHAAAADGFAIQRRGIKPDKAWSRILHLELMPDHTLPATMIDARNFLPIQLGNIIGDRPPFAISLEP